MLVVHETVSLAKHVIPEYYLILGLAQYDSIQEDLRTICT